MNWCKNEAQNRPIEVRVRPNCRFNADANTGHAFGIFMACVGTLRTSCYGAG